MSERVLIWDGATGTQYQAANLPDEAFILTPEMFSSEIGKQSASRLNGEFLEGCNEVLAFTRPDVIYDVHKQYLDAGSDMIESNTFGANLPRSKSMKLAIFWWMYAPEQAKSPFSAARDASTSDKRDLRLAQWGQERNLLPWGQIDWKTLVQATADSKRSFEPVDGCSSKRSKTF
ncbi:MAG: homocysteine S-methyltransferase family protein [Fimbriimonadaceae bacterium]